MSKLDIAKENLAYMRLWLGLVLAILMALVGWLVNNATSQPWLFVAAAVSAVVIFLFVAWRVHKHIVHKIALLENL
jgi:membrane protein YdbS with pleckstrin-like domain